MLILREGKLLSYLERTCISPFVPWLIQDIGTSFFSSFIPATFERLDLSIMGQK